MVNNNKKLVLIIVLTTIVLALLFALGFLVYRVGGAHKPISLTKSGNRHVEHRTETFGDKALVVWIEDGKTPATDVYAQLVDGDGGSMWGVNGKTITTTPGIKSGIELAADSSNVYISWASNQNGQNDIYMQGIDKSGKALWSEPVPIADGASDQSNQQVYINEAGILVVWQEYSDQGRVRARFIDKKTGENIWPGSLSVAASPYLQAEPRIVGSDKNWIIVWQQQSEDLNTNIYAQKIDVEGKLLWGQGIAITEGKQNREDASIVPDKNGGLYVVWENVVDVNSISAQHINADGKLSWDKNGVPVSTVKRIRWHPVALLAEGLLTVIWKEEDKGDDVYAQKFSSKGERLWGDSGVSLSSADKDQAFISGISNESGQVAAVWQDARNGGIDVFGQLIDTTGKNLWQKDGKLVFREEGFDQIEPSVASIGSDKLFVSCIKTGKSASQVVGVILENK